MFKLKEGDRNNFLPSDEVSTRLVWRGSSGMPDRLAEENEFSREGVQ